VETVIPWPTEHHACAFEGREIHVLPGDAAMSPTVAVAYHEPLPADPVFEYGDDGLGEPRCPNQADAARVIKRFLSDLAFRYGYGITEHNAQGGPLHAVPRPHGPRCDGPGLTFASPSGPTSNDRHLALALFREGLSLNSVPYQFLSFAKVLNVKLGKGAQQISWINQHVSDITDPVAQIRIRELKSGHVDVGRHLVKDMRDATAHARGDGVMVDPDDPEHIERLRSDLPLMQAMAKAFIALELYATRNAAAGGD
jgi:hypothetical protein